MESVICGWRKNDRIAHLASHPPTRNRTYHIKGSG